MTYYDITKIIGSPYNPPTPISINDHGIIVGSTYDSRSRGFVEDTHTGVISDIDRASQLGIDPRDINNNGQVVGSQRDDHGMYRGFVYDTATGIRTALTIDNSSLQAINDAGLAIGFSSDASGVNHGIIDDTRTGTIAALHIPLATNAIPVSVNQAGDIGGDYTDASGHQNGFVRHPDGTFTWVHVPSTSKTFVDAINDEGQVAGTYIKDKVYHGFVEDLSTHTYQTFDVPNSTSVEIKSINDQGLILGDSVEDASTDHGFIYDTKTHELLSFNVPGALWTEPAAMNDQGQIVGTFEGNSTYAFLADPSIDPPCYCPGTMIATERGERPVEQLAIGDRLITASGRVRPIKWVGHTRYDAQRIGGNVDVLPVCIKAGALGSGLPRRDLWVSPGHAMLVDGALVQARMLINGVSIVQAKAVTALTYVHVELDDHDVIVAEGAKAESFLDNGCRRLFGNAADFRQRYPEFKPGRPCMPLLEDGFVLQAIRQRIDERAAVARPDHQEPGPLRGFVDSVAPTSIRGWAQDRSRPEEAVCLDVLVDGARVLRLPANRRRGDLVKAGLGSGRHAFEAQLPGKVKGRIEVRRSRDQALLALTTAARLEATMLL